MSVSDSRLPAPSPLAVHWALDAGTVFLNHGSFGATPIVVQQAQQRWRERMEADPVQFFLHDAEPAMDRARRALAAFVGADADDLALVSNATSGVSTVLSNLRFAEGDELMTTNQGYNACTNALRVTAERWGAQVTVARVPFDGATPESVTQAVLDAVSPRTRLVLLDHVTSPTGLVWPVEALVPALEARGIPVLVDGAHAPGMVPLDLMALGASYYTGNCHKWMCTPKGSAFLYVRRDRQAGFHPLTISHGVNTPRTDRSRFRLEADWVGTLDPSPWLVIPDAIAWLGALDAGGWEAHRAANRAAALAGRAILCDALGVQAPVPESMVGALAAVPLPDDPGGPSTHPLYLSALQVALYEQDRVQVPIVPWPSHPRRVVRIAMQRYNSLAQVQYLADALLRQLHREGTSLR